MIYKTMFIALAVLSSTSAICQKIKTDEIDKESKLRIVETDSKKIPVSDISLSPIEGNHIGELKSMQVSVLSYGRSKFLRLDWTNTATLNAYDFDSSYFLDNAGRSFPIAISDNSGFGRKRNMVTQSNQTLYDNVTFLNGDFAKGVRKIIFSTKDGSKMEINLSQDASTFVRNGNILISNTANIKL
ncbi:MAG: hypothetical protein QM610_05915 [Chitinophagaceae bacterium]